jgi:CTP:molybdopterin cytidylyltransferase MocA
VGATDDPSQAGWAAVLLAAGSGSRMGTRPKCLLELDGVPLVRRQLEALAGAGAQEIVVVLGHHAALVGRAVPPQAATVVHNPHPDEGQVSSQRIGLAALSGRPAAVMVALADQPLLDAQDVAALVAAWQRRSALTQVVHPEVGGQRGNPVIFSGMVRDEILAAPAHVGCRQWQAAHPAAVAAFVSDNSHYRLDLDTPEDVARFERETGRALRWPAALAAR